MYGAISCLFLDLYVSLLSLRHLGMKSKIANSNITNERIDAMVIHTILFVLGDFLEFPELDFSPEGPSACLDGLFPDEGGGFGFCWVPGPGKKGSVGGGTSEGDGGGKGAALELNGFPSPLCIKTNINKKN